MTRKSEEGLHILSAGEIATYVVCPEAWKLTYLDKTDTIQTESKKRGQNLHDKWNVDVHEAFYFTQSIKLIVLLIFLSLLVFVVSF